MKHGGTRPLSTSRLLLRSFCPADADSCLKNWASDPEVYRWISQQPITPQEVSQWLSTANEAYAAPDTYYWAIVERGSGEVIGEIFVDDCSRRSRRCELDWTLGSAYWRHGYATEAAAAVIAYLFSLGFHRVQAKCCIENGASARVMQRLGMQQEGVLHDFFFGKDGQWHDVALYAMINTKEASV